jgi:hypothetical protein
MREMARAKRCEHDGGKRIAQNNIAVQRKAVNGIVAAERRKMGRWEPESEKIDISANHVEVDNSGIETIRTAG